jgi:hypothetical protein
MPTTICKWLLVLAAIANFLVALFHLVIVFVGAPGYRYFGVRQLAEMQEKGSILPTALTLALTFLFASWATYALSGAGVIRRLPLLKTVLIAIGVVYTLRGIFVIQNIILLATGASWYPMASMFSGIALMIGIAYLGGSASLFKKKEVKGEA